jgi:hypothetical protein
MDKALMKTLLLFLLSPVCFAQFLPGIITSHPSGGGGGTIVPTPFTQVNLDGCTTSGTGCAPSSNTNAFDTINTGSPATWHGTASGGTGFYDTGQSGLFSGVAGHFNGTDNYVVIPQANSSGAGSLMIFAKSTGTPAVNQVPIDERSTSGIGFLFWLDTSGKANFYVNNIGPSTYSVAVNDGAWHCWAGVWTNGGPSVQIYMDGTAGPLVTGASAGNTGGTGINIGYVTFSPVAGNHYAGDLADAAVWYTAITPANITNNCGVWAFNVIPGLRPLNRPEWAYGATEEHMNFLKRKLAA